MSTEYQDFIDDTWISTCCGAPALGEVDEYEEGKGSGICRACRDHADFERSDDEN